MHIIQSIFNRFTAHFSHASPEKNGRTLKHKDHLTSWQIIAMHTKITPLMTRADKHAFGLAREASKKDSAAQDSLGQSLLNRQQVSEPTLICRVENQQSAEDIELNMALQASRDEQLAQTRTIAAEDAELDAALQASLDIQKQLQPVLGNEEINQQIKSDAQVAQELHDSLNEENKPVLPQLDVDEEFARLPSEKPRSAYKPIADDWRSAILEGNEKMFAAYHKKNLMVVSNQGLGHQCLLISLLQHAKGDYTQTHESLVKKYRKELVHHNPNIGMDDSLNRDTADFAWLLNKINHDLKTDISIDFQSPLDSSGTVLSIEVGKGSQKKIIFDQGGHYEAVTAIPLQ